MKKIFYLLVIVPSITLLSCSKDAKINRKLEGSWNVTKLYGEPPLVGENYTMTFAKTEKKEGIGILNITNDFGNYGYSFTYLLSDEKFIMTRHNGGFFGNVSIFTFNKFSKSKIILTDDVTGKVTEMSKM